MPRLWSQLHSATPPHLLHEMPHDGLRRLSRGAHLLYGGWTLHPPFPSARCCAVHVGLGIGPSSTSRCACYRYYCCCHYASCVAAGNLDAWCWWVRWKEFCVQSNVSNRPNGRWPPEQQQQWHSKSSSNVCCDLFPPYFHAAQDDADGSGAFQCCCCSNQ